MALLKFKRSATPSKVPTTSDLALGELALNTYDGKVYMKKDDGTQAIVEVGGASGSGTVTSVDVSGGTTGLTFSGGPVTSSGTITQGGTLNVANGGTGASSLTSGYVLKGNGTSPVSASVIYDDGTNVGIGTSSPSRKLHVNAGSANTALQIESTDAIVGLEFKDTAGTATISSSGDFRFSGTSGEVVRMESGGNVGIGTTSPDSKVDIEAANSQLRLTDSDDSKFVEFSYSSGKLITRNNSTSTTVNQFTLDESGRLGIGTISPSQTLQVQGTGYATSDFRAPRFYDSNNTAFYVDAASTSVFNKLTTSRASADQLKLERTNSDNNVNIEFVGTSNTGYLGKVGTDLYWGANADLNNLGYKIFHDNYHPNADRWTTARTLSLTNDVTGSVSWDGSGNASLSSTLSATLTPLRATELSSSVDLDNLVGSSAGFYYQTANADTTGNNYPSGEAGSLIVQKSAGNATQLYLTYASSSPKMFFRANYTTGYGSWYQVLDSGGQTQTKSGILQSSASLRAPIFYDSDNTGYYVNPNSTSVLWEGQVKGNRFSFELGTEGVGNTNRLLSFEGNYTNGQYAHRFRKEDVSGGVPLSLDYSQATAGSYTELIQWGPFTGDAGYRIRHNDSTLISGILNATSDVRAPIFYDSNNTGFNLNANGSAWQLQTPTGYLRAGPMNTGFCHFNTDRARYYFDKEVQFDGGINDYSGNWRFNDSLGQHDASLRAPIFYDSANTNYYVDPASGSNLNGTLTNNGGTAMTAGWNRNIMLSSTYPVLVFNSNNTKYSGIGVDYGTAAAGLYFWVNGSSSDLTGTGTVALSINTGNYVTATGSFRAPIFYDSNNTNFYVNPDGTTSANFNGDINFGGELNMVSTTAQNKYIDHHGDLRFRYSNNSSFFNERLRIAGASNFTQATGSLRAPLFYDSDDTGYYINPNATSNCSTVQAINFQAIAGHGYGYRFWASDSYKIYMSSTGNGTWGGRVAGETTSDYNMYFRMTGGTNRGFVFSAGSAGTTKVAGIDASGNGRFIGDVVAYSSSDARLKENLEVIPNALDKVQALSGYTFDWNDKQDAYEVGKRDVGVIAQDVEAVLPEVVVDRELTGYKAVNYEKLVPLLIEAIKELKAEVETLKKG